MFRNALWFTQEKLFLPERSVKEWFGVLVISKNISFCGDFVTQYAITSAKSLAVVE